MRRVVIGMHAGMAGTDSWEFVEVPDGISDEELSEFAWRRAIEHAEGYGIYWTHYSDDQDSDDACYSENIEGWWEPYDSAKHDGYSFSGTPCWEQY